MQGFMFRIELLTPQGWSLTEEHEQRVLAELQAMLKSLADGRTYRVTSPELSSLCVFTQQGSFNLREAAVPLRLGRQLDQGTVNLGCRLG